MSEEPKLKLLKFPKSEPKSEIEVIMSPQEEILLQAYKLHPKIKNVVVLIQTEGNEFTAFNAIDENVDMWSFIDLIRFKSLQAVNEYLTNGTAGPLEPGTA